MAPMANNLQATLNSLLFATPFSLCLHLSITTFLMYFYIHSSHTVHVVSNIATFTKGFCHISLRFLKFGLKLIQLYIFLVKKKTYLKAHTASCYNLLNSCVCVCGVSAMWSSERKNSILYTRIYFVVADHDDDGNNNNNDDDGSVDILQLRLVFSLRIQVSVYIQ